MIVSVILLEKRTELWDTCRNIEPGKYLNQDPMSAKERVSPAKGPSAPLLTKSQRGTDICWSVVRAHCLTCALYTSLFSKQ